MPPNSGDSCSPLVRGMISQSDTERDDENTLNVADGECRLDEYFSAAWFDGEPCVRKY